MKDFSKLTISNKVGEKVSGIAITRNRLFPKENAIFENCTEGSILHLVYAENRAPEHHHGSVETDYIVFSFDPFNNKNYGMYHGCHIACKLTDLTELAHKVYTNKLAQKHQLNLEEIYGPEVSSKFFLSFSSTFPLESLGIKEYEFALKYLSQIRLEAIYKNTVCESFYCSALAKLINKISGILNKKLYETSTHTTN